MTATRSTTARDCSAIGTGAPSEETSQPRYADGIPARNRKYSDRPTRWITQSELESYLDKAADIPRGNADHSKFRGCPVLLPAHSSRCGSRGKRGGDTNAHANGKRVERGGLSDRRGRRGRARRSGTARRRCDEAYGRSHSLPGDKRCLVCSVIEKAEHQRTP